MMISDKFLPLQLFPESLKYSLQIKIIAKVPKHKSMVYMMTVKTFGEVQKKKKKFEKIK
jgi:hypothetical protein